jgi:hypothetical protein
MVVRLVNTGMERMWKEAVMIQFEALFRDAPGETEENHENSWSG